MDYLSVAQFLFQSIYANYVLDLHFISTELPWFML